MLPPKYTYKQKTYFLGFIILLLIVLCFKLSFNKTSQAKKTYIELSKAQNELAGATKKLAYYRKELEKIDIELGSQLETVENSNYQNLTKYCLDHKLVIREIPNTHVSENQDIIVETDIFHIEGAYTELVKLIYSIGRTIKIGKVVSSLFYVYQDRKAKKDILIAEIHVQNIRKNETKKDW